MAKELARYEANDGKEIVLTEDYIRRYICKGDDVTREDMHYYASMCEAYKMNPILDADLIKRGQNVTIQPKASYWMRIASAHPQFDGMELGITVVKSDGTIERREGSMSGKQTEKLIGGWARVYRKDRSYPAFDEVALSEYIGKKKDGTPTKAWREMPGTMIRKVAKVHALREAFPECFGEMYSDEEMQQAQPQSEPQDIEAAVEAVFEGAEVYEDPRADQCADIAATEYIEEAF